MFPFLSKPLVLEVHLSPAEDVLALREEIERLEREKVALLERVRLEESRYVTESRLNMELLDLCREHGISVRRSFPRHK